MDYSNLREVDRRNGVVYITEKILNAIGPGFLGTRNRVTFRFYDGWYELQSLTKNAQSVSADIQNNMPRTVTLRDASTSKNVIVNVELAYTLRNDPNVHLWHTFRPKSGQRNLTCKVPQAAGCNMPVCPLSPVTAFFLTGACPEASCAIRPHDLLVRNEQKLVDTMIASDMFSIHLDSASEAVLVSSDDDLFPPIRTLVKLGTTVLHVLTHPPSHSMPLYLRDLSSKYVQIRL